MIEIKHTSPRKAFEAWIAGTDIGFSVLVKSTIS